MKVAVDTDPLLAKPATGCGGVVDDAVAAAASNGHPWNPVPHLRAMWFRSDSGRADSSAPLDGLRALAFLWVVQYHVSLAITDANTGLPILNALVWQGSCGVSLFFVLSGFLVGRVFDRLLARKDAAFRPAYGTFLYWGFVLSTQSKVLSLGFGLLGYRAWASKESVDHLGEATKVTFAKVQKASRRMTMGAGDLVRMASGSKAKEN